MPLLQFPDQPLHIVEIAVARVAIQQNRNLCGIRHEFQIVQDLGPTGFIVVPHAKLRGNGESACPDPFKPGFLDDFGTQPIMGFANKFQLGRKQEFFKLRGFIRE